MGERTDEVIIQETVTEHQGLSDVDRLHAEIEHTRSEIARALDEIKFQLSPAHLREKATASVKEASIGRAKRFARRMRIRQTMREHPITSTIMGLSTLWLLREGFRARTKGNGEALGESYGAGRYEGGIEGVQPEEKKEQLKRGFESAREKAEQMGQQMRERSGEYGERVKARASEFKEKASDYMFKSRRAATERKDRLQESFYRMKSERPLVLAASAFALGAIIGSLIPETRKEHELMGQPKGRIAERLREKSQESFERAKTVAKDVAEEVEKKI